MRKQSSEQDQEEQYSLNNSLLDEQQAQDLQQEDKQGQDLQEEDKECQRRKEGREGRDPPQGGKEEHKYLINLLGHQQMGKEEREYLDSLVGEQQGQDLQQEEGK